MVCTEGMLVVPGRPGLGKKAEARSGLGRS